MKMAQTQKKKSNTSTKKGNASSGKTVKNTSKNKKTVSKPPVKRNVAAPKEKIISSKEARLHMEIKFWVSLAIAVMLELSNFGVMGKLGSILSSFMFGMFGIMAYVFPIALFVGYIFFIVNFSNSKMIMKLVTGVLLFLLMCALSQLVYRGAENIDFYNVCASNRAGGGMAGGFIAIGMSGIIGVFGAYVLILFLTLICIIVITEKSLVGGIRTGYKATKGNIRRMQQESDIIRNERNSRSRKRRGGVSGVATNLQLINPNKPNEELHEIHESFPNGAVIKGENIKGELKREKIEKTEKTETPVVENDGALREAVTYTKKSAAKESKVESSKPEISESSMQASQAQMELKPYEKPEEKDENEVFTPKEKIQVSKSAKAVMDRKPFSKVPVPDNSGAKGAEIKQADMSVGITTEPERGRIVEKKNSNNEVYRYEFPPLSLLKKGVAGKIEKTQGLSETAFKLEEILKNFGVNVTVTNESRGPSVTRYELQPEMGTKVSKITALTDDIKLNLAAADIRIEAPIPGKAAVGIEVPNEKREPVFLRDLIESKELINHPSKLAFAAGKDIAGNVIVADIAKMPHMLIAGTTGSGKSVFTNSIIMSILFRADPNEVKLLIVDPKVVEFGVYNGIPHLLTPVVTDPKKAAGALAWASAEMTRRYEEFAKYGVRDVKGYNEKIEKIEPEEGQERPERMPQILIIIDELADLMMVAAKEVETSICRLAQLARAAGIHLVIATQRPSVDVVTGLIKANVPSRVALLVSSGVDSRTIIDINGAEKLLGNGDMLFYPSGYVKPVRVQGAFVSDSEVQSVVEFIVSHTEKIEYNEEITNQPLSSLSGNDGSGSSENDENANDAYFAEAGRFVIEKGKGSTSMVQRMFRVGFNRAARIIDQLEQAGVVGEEEGTKPRKVLMSMEQFEEYLKNEQ